MVGLRECSVCHKTFRPLVGNQKKCSLCKGYKPRQPVIRTEECVVCGKVFDTHLYNKKFCSPACRKEYHYSPLTIIKVCKYCGKEFETTQKRQIYCSAGCRLEKYKPVRVNVEQANTKVVDHDEELEERFENAGDVF